MIKSRKHVESNVYKEAGNIHWKAAKGQYYTPGLHTTGIAFGMMSKKGMRKLVIDDRNKVKMMVTFDREYVFETVLRTVVARMGILADGNLNEKMYDLFFADLKQYALTSGEREREATLKQEAQRLHEQFPHKTVEQWLLELSPQCNEPATADTSNQLTDTDVVDQSHDIAVDDTRVQDSSSNKVESDNEIDYETWGMSDDGASGLEIDSLVMAVLEQEDTIALSSTDSSELEKATPRKRGRPRKLS